MGETTFILKDANEKRVMTIHYGNFFELITPVLGENPKTIQEFNELYKKVNKGTLYVDGPTVPPVVDIRRILGSIGSDNDVIAHWRDTNTFEKRNYQSYKPNEKTEEDIPELTKSLLENILEQNDSVTGKEWAQVPESVQRKIRRRSVSHDGIIEVDLTKAQIRYISNNCFSIEQKGTYSVPGNWKIVEE